MAGAAVERELTSATRFAVASNADDAAIRRLLRDNPMRGAVSLSFEREPDYFRGADLAGGKDQTIIAFSGSRLVCMGRCTQRECWVDDETRRVAYLAELRLDAAARSRFQILRDGYEFFHTLQREDPTELYFTSIAADNDRARRLLENGARGLPAYSFLGELDTLLVAIPYRPRTAKVRVETATTKHVPDMLRLLNSHALRHQFAAVWTTENLHALAKHGLPLDQFLIALDGDRMVACGGLWDQRTFRQIVVRGYSPALSAARPLVNFAASVLGTTRLPRPNSVLAHAFLSPLAFESGAETMLPDFIEAFFPLAQRIGIEFLTIALPTTDSRLAALRQRFSTRTWRSRLYRVNWWDQAPFEFSGKGVFLPEVALL